MEIRKSKLSDLEKIMNVYNEAKLFMISSGNPNQWIDGYPRKSLIESDIMSNNSYVCINEDKIVGTFYFYIGNDVTYNYIEKGKWLNDDLYGVIHRIASLKSSRGVGRAMLDYCFSLINNIKIDTHHDNKVMKNFLIKFGFTECGIIYLENGDERIAYQKNKEE